MRRVMSDAMISMGAVLLLLVILVSIDARVRDQVAGLVGGSGSPELSRVASDAAAVIFTVARDQSIAHAPLMIFALASMVLFLFMIRT
jgi:hypothetical protein